MRQFARNVVNAPFAAALAFLAVQSGIRGLIDPHSLPLLAIIGWVAYVWAIVYTAGGLFLVYGMGSLKAKFEAAGCVLFGGGALVQAFVTAFFIGRNPFLSYWSVSALVVFGIAGVLRATHLVKGQRLLWIGAAS